MANSTENLSGPLRPFLLPWSPGFSGCMWPDPLFSALVPLSQRPLILLLTHRSLEFRDMPSCDLAELGLPTGLDTCLCPMPSHSVSLPNSPSHLTPVILPNCWSFLELAEFFPSIPLLSCAPSWIVCLVADLESCVFRGCEACSLVFLPSHPLLPMVPVVYTGACQFIVSPI